MVALSNLIQCVKPSPTLAAAARANQLKAAGKDIVSFTVGEPDFDTPQHIKDAAIEALKKGFTKYTATEGILPLREVIVEKMKRDQGLTYTAAEVIVTNGGKQALTGAFEVLLNPGDEVVIPAPYWTSYPDMAALFGAVPVVVRTEAKDGYLMSPEALKSACTDRTKIIVLNSPSNPTGACYSGEDLKTLAAVIEALPNKNIVVITDEVYEYITYDNFKHISFAQVAPQLRDRTIIVNAFSKAYSMTGWRVGYAVGPKEIIKAMNTAQSQITSNVCSIAQYAAASAYKDDYAFPKMMAEQFAKRIDIVSDAVAKMPGISLPVRPRGAFYAFLRVEELFGKKNGETVIRSGGDFANYLLNNYDVVVVQGEAFGDPGAVRLSFALAEERLKVGLARISEAVRTLA